MTLPAFETPRLTLRSLTAHDAEGLHEAYGDADAMRHWDLLPSRDVSQRAERIRMSTEADPRWHGMWAIRLMRAGSWARSTITRTTNSNGDSRPGGS
jgi:RimJ/RimL family protein N-acetyltransferase